MRRVFVIGYPSYVGGADTELWHTIKLWRAAGVDVSLIPTWHAPADWRTRLDQISAKTVSVVGPSELSKVAGLAGSTIVSFCNGELLENAAHFRELGCKIVWVNCMTWVFPKELEHYEQFSPFDAYVFQSAFQRSCIFPELEKFGLQEEQCFQIRGAFAPTEFAFTPLSHRPDEPFVMGRIARPDADKWSSNHWKIYAAVQYANKRARVMAWSDKLTEKSGEPPRWAETLSANAEPAQQFLQSLHCLFPINGGAQENWPRSGLEAMASGVPIVAQAQWGWTEMIEHGVTGFLGNDDCELAHYAALLAHDEELRLQIALNARQRLVETLANPSAISTAWLNLFEQVNPSRDANDVGTSKYMNEGTQTNVGTAKSV